MDYKKLIGDIDDLLIAHPSENVSKMYLRKAADAIKQLITNGVTAQEWISVEDRLPENIANRVLVVCERSNGVFYAHYEKPFWINLETDKPFISTVTHWMPLPPVPEDMK